MTLAALAAQAAAHWGGRPLALIRNRENAVFRMELPGGRRAALRLHRQGYQSASAIGSELWWCGALAAQGLPVPRPLPGRDGGLLMRLAGGRLASAVEWLPGDPLGEAGKPLAAPVEMQLRRHHALGRLLARIHDATDAMQMPGTFDRPCWGLDGLLGDTPFWGRFWEHPALTAPEAARMAGVRLALRDRLAGALQGQVPAPVHADVLRENVLVAGETLSLIDFDDCGTGFRLYDLGTVLSQNLYEAAREEIRAALIEGYSTLRPADPALVDLFTLARTLASVGWTMPRLAPDDPVNRSHIARALLCADRVLG
ncbi:phosphotransferase enzyme family protein [Szabonella alba]|uniref:Phosphotransferase n=1 Tax=Szabonella alba TaxID=2804194 RepID=A0A8K0VDC8_9RHOB|nr:phosphotransferase [Szabonella alba]MBL4917065.1 phosphotransferase [Szabonella alba]